MSVMSNGDVSRMLVRAGIARVQMHRRIETAGNITAHRDNPDHRQHAAWLRSQEAGPEALPSDAEEERVWA